MDPRSYRRAPEPPGLPPTPLWFKLWFAFCALVGAAGIGVGVWAIVKLVDHVTASR